ncbi:MAG TPA: MerR family transcriptional regulator [Capsulimonadaceae bacterium]|nr:MerR family transcriptional regulator [Capsulimonadaceae bacterium]
MEPTLAEEGFSASRLQDRIPLGGTEPDETEGIDQPTSETEPLYVISVAAKLVRMPAWTLRVLDEQGIVVPKRTDKNRRLYSDRDLRRLARVRKLTEEMGINMNGVRLILQLEEERDKGDLSS